MNRSSLIAAHLKYVRNQVNIVRHTINARPRFFSYHIDDPKRKRLHGPVRSPEAKANELAHHKMLDTKKNREDLRRALVDIIT
jgi:hypothetical protein